MPQFQITKGGVQYNLTADSQEEAIKRVEYEHAQRQAESQLDALDGEQVAPTPDKPDRDRSIQETFEGYLDAAATLGSEVLAGGAEIAGFPVGLGKAALDGTLREGTGIETIRETMDEFGNPIRRAPTTEVGTEVLTNIGEAIEPITRADQLGPLNAIAGVAPVGAIAPRVAVTAATRAAGNAAEAARDALSEVNVPLRPRRDADTGLSVGARQTPDEAQTIEIARNAGLTGEAAPSRGQITRDADQLRFENDTMDTPAGAPLRNNRAAQQQALAREFERIEDEFARGKVFADDDEQGRAIKAAAEAAREAKRQKRNRLYQEAREAGELDAPIVMESLPTALKSLEDLEDFVSGNKAVKQYAIKNGIIDEQGRLRPTTIDDAETFRQFVNNAYDMSDPRSAMERGKVVSAIDEAMNAANSGEKFQRARNYAAKYYDEFNATPITRALTNNKRGSNVGVDDAKVVDKLIKSSNAEIDRFKNTLRTTPEGREQWNAIQARFVEQLQGKAFGTQTDSRGNRLATPATFTREIEKLNKSGKLDKMLGKETAEKMVDLSTLINRLMTSPPGTKNHSGTVQAIKNMLRAAPGLAKVVPFLDTMVGGAEDMVTKSQVKKALDTKGLFEDAM